MAFLFQDLTNLPEIVYFSVVDYVHSSVVTGHRLPTSIGEINHRQPPVTQTNAVDFIKKKT